MTADLIQLTAQCVGAYIRKPEPQGETELSSCLERLLQRDWQSHGHSKWRWFDGLVGATFAVCGNQLLVRGWMSYGERGGGRQWIDVFAADLALEDSQLRYALRFGLKGREAPLPYTDRPKVLHDFPEMSADGWTCSFSSSSG